MLNINLNYIKSSEINTVGNKAKKLFNICEKLSTNIMLANEGSKNYIEEEIDIFNEKNIKNCTNVFGLHMIEMFKTKVVLDKPIYVGTTILDLSKLLMMRFHYRIFA